MTRLPDQTADADYTVESLSAEVPVAEYVRTCVDVDKFLDFCRECGNYGIRWACPPFDFDPLALWRRFRVLRLSARVLTPLPGADVPAMLEGLKLEKAALLEKLLAQEAANAGSMALSAGTCNFCETCTRSRGLPCRTPARMRYSIEALGGDVSRTAERYLYRPLLWIKGNRLPGYLMLVGGLCLP